MEIYVNAQKSMGFFREKMICKGDYFKRIGCSSDHFDVFIQPYYYLTDPILRSRLRSRTLERKAFYNNLLKKLNSTQPTQTLFSSDRLNVGVFNKIEESIDRENLERSAYRYAEIEYTKFGKVNVHVSCFMKNLQTIHFYKNNTYHKLLLGVSLSSHFIKCTNILIMNQSRHIIISGVDDITVIQL